MTVKQLVAAVAFAMCCLAASAGFCGDDPRTAREFSDATLAKVVPGQTTKAQVEALLGKPWRDTELDPAHAHTHTPGPSEPYVDIWEYRGRDSNGTYRVHIEFDSHNITTLIAKIPDKTAQARARVAQPTPGPGKRSE
jgi:outer membrane protein assembly factor BamE (lipoprotein component of BamABCDE complex)